jgi:hypothetical protein
MLLFATVPLIKLSRGLFHINMQETLIKREQTCLMIDTSVTDVEFELDTQQHLIG